MFEVYIEWRNGLIETVEISRKQYTAMLRKNIKELVVFEILSSY